MSLTFAETNTKGQRRTGRREVWWSRPASDTPTGTSVGVFCGKTGHAQNRHLHAQNFFGAYFSQKAKKAEAVYFSGKKRILLMPFTRKSRLLLRKKIAGEKFSGRIFLQKEEERTKEEEKCDYLSKQPMIFRGEGSGLGTALICKDDAFRTVADKRSERRRAMLK